MRSVVAGRLPAFVGTRVFSLIAAKEITSVKIGNLRRIPVDAVREYADRLVQLEREAG